MKTLLIVLTLLIPLTVWGEEPQIRTKFTTDLAPAGSSLNPYILTDEQGNETVLRPKFRTSLDPGNPDYDPGGRHNPLEVDR